MNLDVPIVKIFFKADRQAGVQTVLQLRDDLFAASNVDGRIAVFRIRSED